jgi:hypothetical protein
MKPQRDDIAAPPFPPGLEWLGGREPKLDKLVTVGPLLVHFFDYAQLNSVRALDYVREWRHRYRDHGLAVLGIHSPRFALTRPADGVEAAVERLSIDWPVALDGDLRAFRGYGCQGWPSLFLWAKGGALRWYHLGEGEYAATEEAIREQLADGSNGGWPDLVAPQRPGDEAGAEVIAPTPEVFPEEEPIELDYAAAAAYAAAAGEGTLSVAVDGGTAREVEVAGPGLYELAPGLHHGEHRLSIRGTGTVEIHSIQFAPGPPG